MGLMRDPRHRLTPTARSSLPATVLSRPATKLARILPSPFPHDYEPGIAGFAPPGFVPTDIDGGTWFIDALTGSTNTLGEILPAGFDAYVRLPHPYWREVPQGTDGAIYDPPDSSTEAGVWLKPVRRLDGAPADQSTIWPSIESVMGTPTVIPAVMDVLRAEAGNVICLCGFWERREASPARGLVKVVYGSAPATVERFRPWEMVRTVLALAKQEHTERIPKDIVLYRGRFDDIRSWLSGFPAMKAYGSLPTAVWPEDRRWCIALPQNKDFSCAAGPGRLMERIRALTEIDAVEAKLSDKVWDDV